MTCKSNSKNYDLDFNIVDTDKMPLLGLSSLIEMNLIQKNELVDNIDIGYEKIINENIDTFKSIGCINKTYHIELKDCTDWVSESVITRRSNGSLRICLDPKDFNEAIKQEYDQMPSLEHLSIKLAGAKYFSTLDTRNGFYQMKLNEERSKLCTFATPFGRYV